MFERDSEKLRQMKDSIDQIEEHAMHLRVLGEGVPTVAKNASTILSAVYILKHGISDIVDLQNAQDSQS